MNEDNDYIVRRIGNCYVQMHQYKEAHDYYMDALERKSDSLELRLDLGMLLLKVGSLGQAREYLDPNKFDDEYSEHTIETLKMAADAYRGLA